MNNLSRFLNPKSIAMVGGREVEVAIQQCQKLGFTGEIWPVNPKRESLAGLPCFDSIASLPGVPDAAFVAIPAEPTIDVVQQLSQIGAGSAVCYASGFREVGSTERHERLLAAAGDMPLIGPNCYGTINALNGAVLWPDQHGLTPVNSGVAIFTGSGNISVNISMQNRSLPIAMIMTVGNQAVVGIEHCIEAALEDNRITAIGIHIEGLKNLKFFAQVAERAAYIGKPIIALKTGKSDIGARITMSHTATLAGESGLYDHFFERLGVAQVDDMESCLEALKLVSITGPLRGGRIASMSCSGGEASLIADLIQDTSLEFPPLTESHRQQVQATLNEYVDVSNPLDYHTFIWGDKARLRDTFTQMLAGDFDITLLLLDYPTVNDCESQDWDVAGEAFAEACQATGKKGAIVCSLAESMPQHVRDHLMSCGVAPLLGMSQAISAIEAAASVCRIHGELPNLDVPMPLVENTQRQSLSEFVAKQQLSEYDLPTTGAQLVNTIDDAVSVAENIGYPVVIKVSGDTLNHKTELNGVALNITDTNAVREQSERLLSISDQLLVEQMIPSGVAELLLGVDFDPQFGHYLIIGFGGTLVELIADRQILLLPASDQQIKHALSQLKTAKLLQGYRGKPAGDIDAVVDTVKKLIHFIETHKTHLLEIDINPLIVGPAGSGVTIADALIVNTLPLSGE